MGVGLHLRGRYRRSLLGRPSPQQWLADASEVWRELEPDAEEINTGGSAATPTLWIKPHPAVEPVELQVTSPGVVEVSANTSTGGPGFHRRVCADLRELEARLSLTWDPSDGEEFADETGYFESGDSDAVDKAMLAWLGAVLEEVSRNRDGGLGFSLSMPLGWVPVTSSDSIATVVGPRGLAWLTRGSEDPRTAIDLFTWWGDDRDAAHFRDRAIARMWMDVRWTAPLDDASRGAQVATNRDLQRAYGLDPELSFPWREWREIRSLLRTAGEPMEQPEIDGAIAERLTAEGNGRPLIGYRRGDVRVWPFPSWSIEIPGSFVDWPDENDAGWVAGDDRRTIRLSSLTVAGHNGEVPSGRDLVAAVPIEGTPIPPEDPSLEGRAALSLDDGPDPKPVLSGVVATDGQVLIATIAYDDDEAWARRTWASIRPQEGLRG